MYGILTYIYHSNQLNVKYTIHGWYGIISGSPAISRKITARRNRMTNVVVFGSREIRGRKWPNFVDPDDINHHPMTDPWDERYILPTSLPQKYQAMHVNNSKYTSPIDPLSMNFSGFFGVDSHYKSPDLPLGHL